MNVIFTMKYRGKRKDSMQKRCSKGYIGDAAKAFWASSVLSCFILRTDMLDLEFSNDHRLEIQKCQTVLLLLPSFYCESEIKIRTFIAY